MSIQKDKKSVVNEELARRVTKDAESARIAMSRKTTHRSKNTQNMKRNEIERFNENLKDFSVEQSKKSKSKIGILLTDGSNSAGEIDPKIAANAAKTLGVKFYTIGSGGDGGNSSFFGFSFRRSGSPIDEPMLKYIAETTGGKYFRARDTNDLVRIYETINELEKTEVETEIFKNYEEKYADLLLPALFLFLFFNVGGSWIYRRFP